MIRSFPGLPDVVHTAAHDSGSMPSQHNAGVGGRAGSGGCLATQEMLQRAVQDALPSAALQGGARYALFLAGEHGVTAQADMQAGARWK